MLTWQRWWMLWLIDHWCMSIRRSETLTSDKLYLTGRSSATVCIHAPSPHLHFTCGPPHPNEGPGWVTQTSASSLQYKWLCIVVCFSFSHPLRSFLIKNEKILMWFLCALQRPRMSAISDLNAISQDSKAFFLVIIGSFEMSSQDYDGEPKKFVSFDHTRFQLRWLLGRVDK